MRRKDGRQPDQLRPVTIQRHYIKHAEGSVLVATGDTHVICTASVIDQQPRFMRSQRIKNKGWVTAEYSMLPRSTSERMQREVTRGEVSVDGPRKFNVLLAAPYAPRLIWMGWRNTQSG